MQYVSNTEQDKAEMLRAIGVRSIEDLLCDIPPALRVKGLNLEAGISEMELLGRLRKLGQKNLHADRFVSFLGAGNYDHYIPPIVNHLATRGEFITAYTPYQGEASQGTLQFIYEFQSLICRLTGLDVSNASMYDGASAAAEAALMILRNTERKQLLIAGAVHPETAETIRTYLSNIDVELVTVGEKCGVTDLEDFERKLSDRTAAVVFQQPNFLGYLEDARRIGELARSRGARVIVSANPLSLAVLEPPCDYGADVAVGDGQPLGNSVSYGGPHFGYFAVRQDLMRKMPGRICGMTVDKEGTRAFVLTLQAREQHIRREKATSNICTNQSLCALKATIFLSILGEHGFRRMGELNLERSHDAFNILRKVKGVRAYAPAPFFNEFVLWIDKDPKSLKKSLDERRISGPLDMSRFGKKWKGAYLVAVTEQRTAEEIERLADAIRKAKG